MAATFVKSGAGLLSSHAPLALNAAALAVRLYAASVWWRFAVAKIEQGWLAGNPMRPLLELVAAGTLPGTAPGYDALAQSALRLGLDLPMARALPLLESVIAAALVLGVRVRTVALLAAFVNLNLLLSGIGNMAIDGRLIVLQLLLLLAGRRAGSPGWRDLRGMASRADNLPGVVSSGQDDASLRM